MKRSNLIYSLSFLLTALLFTACDSKPSETSNGKVDVEDIENSNQNTANEDDSDNDARALPEIKFEKPSCANFTRRFFVSSKLNFAEEEKNMYMFD